MAPRRMYTTHHRSSSCNYYNIEVYSRHYVQGVSRWMERFTLIVLIGQIFTIHSVYNIRVYKDVVRGVCVLFFLFIRCPPPLSYHPIV